MGLLVDLIVWLFKNLFGDQEAQANVGPGEERNAGEGRRGPYVYGDEASSDTTTRPKTLAELLEEARQQTRGSAPPAGYASAPAAKPKRPSPPPPQVSAPPQQSAEPASAAAFRPLSKTVALPRTPELPKLQEVAAPAEASEEAPAAPKRSKKRKAHPEESKTPVRAGLLHTDPKKAAEPGRIRVAPSLAPWMAALRDTNGNEKAQLGAQAIMSMEIFGRPRCSRPHRPGARFF